MHKRWKTALPAVFLACAVGAAGAQDFDVPAEFPPEGYSDRQYVDSRGCVYVRAGFDGNVTWVPRLTRDREPICGQTPTFAGNRGTPAPEPAPERTAPPPRTVATAPATAPRATPPRQAAPPPRTARPAPQPRTVRTAPRRKAPAGAAACPGMSGLSAAYMRSSDGYPVRCGPQAESPYGPRSDAGGATLTPPEGYKTAFDDGRLNPYRGIQTVDGWARMSLIWTQTVPRRLIDQNTGRDVTGRFPDLRYPYTTLAEQRAAAENGRRVTVTAADGSTATARVVPGGGARISTKSVEPAADGARYVKVATYGDESHARTAIATLQRMGLPVRVGRYTRGGKPYQTVLAGPFGTADGMQRALAAARQAGFANAVPRD